MFLLDPSCCWGGGGGGGGGESRSWLWGRSAVPYTATVRHVYHPRRTNPSVFIFNNTKTFFFYFGMVRESRGVEPKDSLSLKHKWRLICIQAMWEQELRALAITEACANILWIRENAFEVFIEQRKAAVSSFGETTNILVHACFYMEIRCWAVMRGSLTFPLGLKMIDLFSSYSRLVWNKHRHQWQYMHLFSYRFVKWNTVFLAELVLHRCVCVSLFSTCPACQTLEHWVWTHCWRTGPTGMREGLFPWKYTGRGHCNRQKPNLKPLFAKSSHLLSNQTANFL